MKTGTDSWSGACDLCAGLATLLPKLLRVLSGSCEGITRGENGHEQPHRCLYACVDGRVAADRLNQLEWSHVSTLFLSSLCIWKSCGRADGRAATGCFHCGTRPLCRLVHTRNLSKAKLRISLYIPTLFSTRFFLSVFLSFRSSRKTTSYGAVHVIFLWENSVQFPISK